MTDERRRFQRISFDADCEVRTHDCSWPVKLIDISLQGVLAEIIISPLLNVGDHADIVIQLNNEITITMPSVLKHQLGNHLGFKAETMDIDSVSHLRRLVELNLGDETLLERELEHLLEAH